MRMNFWMTLAVMAALSALTGCGVLLGGAAAVGADAVAEEEGGNLF